MRVVGVDVGARRLHAVALDGEAVVVASGVFDAVDLDRLVGWSAGVDEVAIDSPDRWSTAPHGADEDLPPKFRTARCAEIALGRERHIWVPWTTPTDPVGGWIQVGIDLFAALRGRGLDPVETFPHAAFGVRARGGRLPPKRTAAGLAARVRLLEEAGLSDPSLPLWSHDALDAAMAAVVALHKARRTAHPVTCGHDSSAIWLPQAAGPPGA